MTIRDGEPRTATPTFTQLLNSEKAEFKSVQCCFTSTGTVRSVRDVARDGRLQFYTPPKL